MNRFAFSCFFSLFGAPRGERRVTTPTMRTEATRCSVFELSPRRETTLARRRRRPGQERTAASYGQPTGSNTHSRLSCVTPTTHSMCPPRLPRRTAQRTPVASNDRRHARSDVGRGFSSNAFIYEGEARLELRPTSAASFKQGAPPKKPPAQMWSTIDTHGTHERSSASTTQTAQWWMFSFRW